MADEATQLALVELESTPLDHSGKLSLPYSILILYMSYCMIYSVILREVLRIPICVVLNN